MNYALTCDCGKTLSVSGTDAGTSVSCACGRAVAVPPLHILRRTAGEEVSSPELEIRVRVASGDLPEGSACASCGKPTRVWATVRVECEPRLDDEGESSNPVGLGFLRGVLGDGLWWYLSWYTKRRAAEAPKYNEHNVLELPIIMCGGCSRGVREAELRRAVEGVSVYGRLLAKYPEAQLSLAQTSSGK